jgi:hypothetical protein
MNNLIKIQGYSNLRKDKTNKGIINVDHNAYQNYLMSKNLVKRNMLEKEQAQQTISSMQEEINNIKDDIGDIKTMLQHLINKDK